MTTTDLRALLPLLGIAATSIVLMSAIAIRRDRRWTISITLVGLAVSLGLLLAARPVVPRSVTALLTIDGYALFFFALLISAAAVVAVLAYEYLERRNTVCDEFYLLLLFATLGSCVLAAASHFASVFLGLEILSVSLYAMVGYFRNTEKSLEAGIKYLILAAVSSAFMLFGMALIYAQTGTMAFSALSSLQLRPGAASVLMTVSGVALMMVGVGFKLALAPFHMWTADVYEGAPAPVTAYVATVSKAAVVALLIRLYAAAETPPQQLIALMALLAGASIIAGNLLALRQDNVKRMLAYSSIAHMGYLMIAVIAGGVNGAETAAFYLAAYLPTTLGAFGVVTVLSSGQRDCDQLNDYTGLGARRPLLAGILTVTMLSLAGIPLTAGFIGKFLVLGAGADSGQWTLTLILVLGSVISIYYYLRVIVAMYMRPADDTAGEPSPARVSLAVGATLAALIAVLLWLGVWPGPLLEFIRTTVGAL
jgi:NADH-quinone oxidoreductase subunit N